MLSDTLAQQRRLLCMLAFMTRKFVTRDEAVKLAEKQRAKQGLPPRIEDVALLTRIAEIMRSVDGDGDGD